MPFDCSFSKSPTTMQHEVIIYADCPDIKRRVEPLTCADCRRSVIGPYEPVRCRSHRFNPPTEGWAWINNKEAKLIDRARQFNDVHELAAGIEILEGADMILPVVRAAVLGERVRAYEGSSVGSVEVDIDDVPMMPRGIPEPVDELVGDFATVSLERQRSDESDHGVASIGVAPPADSDSDTSMDYSSEEYEPVVKLKWTRRPSKSAIAEESSGDEI